MAFIGAPGGMAAAATENAAGRGGGGAPARPAAAEAAETVPESKRSKPDRETSPRAPLGVAIAAICASRPLSSSAERTAAAADASADGVT